MRINTIQAGMALCYMIPMLSITSDYVESYGDPQPYIEQIALVQGEVA